ncbi:Hypothetical predicted protein [Marmota monax]|uniref:Probable U3 small nucleolar RNA-associated protein 11 n=1 Tax=Marmota monax TaxID=9995 RepID=A0A5E4A504_MARMO|nr:Hypothetical predicted protein [Marmota monax]
MAAAFRKAAKSRQREHRERSQPGFRKHLGLLEKKKDYKLRADDYHKKQEFLRALRKKALEKNPDEFYYKMTRVKLQDGVHIIKETKEEVTPEQLKLMRTQDIKYIEMKRVAEAKKIERLKSELHLLDFQGKQQNKHVFFFDTKKEVEQFDIATHLQTAPELVDRVFNRPRIETLQKEKVKGITHQTGLKVIFSIVILMGVWGNQGSFLCVCVCVPLHLICYLWKTLKFSLKNGRWKEDLMMRLEVEEGCLVF